MTNMTTEQSRGFSIATFITAESSVPVLVDFNNFEIRVRHRMNTYSEHRILW